MAHIGSLLAHASQLAIISCVSMRLNQRIIVNLLTLQEKLLRQS